jgi:hypothetical protein
MSSSLYMKTDTDQVSDTLFSSHFEFRTMDKPNYSEHYMCSDGESKVASTKYKSEDLALDNTSC